MDKIIFPVLPAIKPNHLIVEFVLQRLVYLGCDFSKVENCLTKERTDKECLDPEDIAEKASI
jgi:hypothetical protein